MLPLLLGSCLGVMRTASSRLANAVGATYVEIFRNVPLLVQMFLWYFVLPELLPHAWGLAMKQMPQPWGQFPLSLDLLQLKGVLYIIEIMIQIIQKC
ncbi:ABC transporter permease subunit [Lactiplantibacillus plantarum]|uniref:ABC transporter permease subunit n=1 Tax=Lactiplantibacillus plantarum TaxID=1590 RepID=UPI004045FB3E